jgi:CRP/FNR family cyclic AMP-dependent transcriptional regulator
VTAGRGELVQGERLDLASIGSRAQCGMVVLSGYLVRELTTPAGRVSADLIGPEDVVQAFGVEPEVPVLEHKIAWTALTDVRLAFLDAEFFARTARWPEVATALIERAGRLGQRLALGGAIATLHSVDARLLASFWTWASQWATVAGQGVVLRVPLSHERIARLIHSRRPTVTTALGRLRRAGLIAHRRDGSWLLHGPNSDNGATAGPDGVVMPMLGEMLDSGLGVRNASATVDASDVLAPRELLESLGIGVAVLDRKLRVTMWNEHAKKLWGLDAGEVRDQNFLDLEMGLPVDSLRDALRACAAGRVEGEEQHINARDRTGRDIVARVLCTPLKTSHGEVSGVIVQMQPLDQNMSAS